LPIKDWRDLDGASFELAPEDADGSIYLGAAHNPVDVRHIQFARVGETTLRIHATLFCDFESEMVGDSALVALTTQVDFQGLLVERDILGAGATTNADLGDAIGAFVSLGGYQAAPQVREHGVWLVPKMAER
jgi:hypothetical protein